MDKQALCPYCWNAMIPLYAVSSGGIWLCKSQSFLKGYIHARVGEADPQQRDPLICVIGNKGYASGTWPKDALYCDNCGSFTIKSLPY